MERQPQSVGTGRIRCRGVEIEEGKRHGKSNDKEENVISSSREEEYRL